MEDTQLKDILLKDLSIDLNKQVLESFSLHRLVEIPKGADASKPFQFNIQSKKLINIQTLSLSFS